MSGTVLELVGNISLRVVHVLWKVLVLVRGRCSRTVRVRVLQGFIFPAARKASQVYRTSSRSLVATFFTIKGSRDLRGLVCGLTYRTRRCKDYITWVSLNFAG